MPSDDESSDLSSLSSLSPAPSGDELEDVVLEQTATGKTKASILKFFPKVSGKPPKEPSPPPPRKRSPSPPHEYVLADNPDVAFLVMFRSRFNDAFPKSLAHFGPQELERDVIEPILGDRVEHFLCALLGLLLNRKQDVKSGHYGRALEDAITSHKSQWPPSWEDKNPLSGGASLNSMKPTERLSLLRNLVLWAMASSETLKALINQAYKQNRHEDDINQPRAVQPWGSDGDKRRYFLIEGQDDTAFRVYRESSHQGMNRTWWSVAGSIEELRTLANKLDNKDGGPKAKKLSQKIMQAVPRFEAGEEKRKRREYRQMRKEQFKRPEPGFSLYEGRTRGKRIKYTFSDEEDVFSDSTGYRRSARNTGANTPAEIAPTVTASGRTVKAPNRLNVATGEDLPGSAQEVTSEADQEDSAGPTGRPRRSAARNPGANGWSGSGSGQPDEDDDMASDDEASDAGFGDDERDVDAQIPEESEDEDEDEFDEDEAMVEDDLDTDEPPRLVVKLSLTAPKLKTAVTPPRELADDMPRPPEGAEDLEDDESKSEGVVVQMSDAPASSQPVGPNDTAIDTEIAAPTTTTTTTTAKNAVRESTPEPKGHTSEILGSLLPATAETSLALRGSPEKPHAKL